jgi:hypothetical protein
VPCADIGHTLPDAMVARVQSVIALVGERFAITASGLKEAGFFGLEIFRSGRRHWAAKRRGSLDKDAVDRPLIAQNLMARVPQTTENS